MPRQIHFARHGPFDEVERAVIIDVVRAVEDRGTAGERFGVLLDQVETAMGQVDQLGEVLSRYPSVFATQSLGNKKRDLASLVDRLSGSTAANFDIHLPTRALVSRALGMAEVNFYRLLRFVCAEALTEPLMGQLRARVDRRLCHALYACLAAKVLEHIASDSTTPRALRNKAVLSLMQLWEQATYSLSEFFPILEATWEARRRVPVTLGTLMGTAEMFRLIEAGCDERFVDYLVRPEHSEDEAAAFREFLFGATTEQLGRLEAHMAESGVSAIAAEDVPVSERPTDACASMGGDPALALYEFFLSRHLQAGTRRLADLPGPKRTAEEYVMLSYLAQVDVCELTGLPPESLGTVSTG